MGHADKLTVHPRAFTLPAIKEPLVAPQAPASVLELPDKYEYDFDTKPGKTYVFTGK